MGEFFKQCDLDIPYWAIVIPLTLLSAYLLKPRPAKLPVQQLT